MIKSIFKRIFVIGILFLLVGAGFLSVEGKFLSNNNPNKDQVFNIQEFPPPDQLDQQQTSDCNFGWNIMEDQWVAQGFEPTLDILTRVELKLFEGGRPARDIQFTVSIRSMLEEDDIVSLTVDAYSLITSTGWYEFDFQDIDVIPNNIYYIVCRTDGGTDSNCYCWLFDFPNPYENGIAWASTDYGDSWHRAENDDHVDTDCCFKTYGKLGNKENSPPNKPSCQYDKSTDQLVITATDPDDDNIKYGVDWNNDTTVDQWTDFVSSGTEVRVNCSYRIGIAGVIVEDEHGAQSDLIVITSKPLMYNIMMFFNRILSNNHISHIFKNFI